jgi:hypothetical protein
MTAGETFRKRCRDLAGVMGWVVVLLLMAIVSDALWEAGLRRLVGQGGGDFRATVHAVGVELVKSLPAICLVGALWSAERVFARMGAGEVMTDANAAGLGECGRWVEGAAVAAFVATPSLLAWIAREGGLHVDFEWGHVALFLLGVALTLLGDVLADAAAARRELDEIV